MSEVNFSNINNSTIIHESLVENSFNTQNKSANLNEVLEKLRKTVYDTQNEEVIETFEVLESEAKKPKPKRNFLIRGAKMLKGMLERTTQSVETVNSFLEFFEKLG